MRRARVLVTNDDGYRSEGMHALAAALESLGEVWIVAPNRERSAVSHALTLDRPLRIQSRGPRHFAVDGTPTDCVALGIASLLADQPPDLVVAGINYGVNMGADVHYSGTVAAAFEGVILGVPALAISQQTNSDSPISFANAAAFGQRLAAWVIAEGLPEDVLLNVNIPVVEAKAVALTRLGKRRYTEGVIKTKDPRRNTIYWIGGGDPVWEATPGTDFQELAQGNISVTPLSLDMTDRGFLRQLEINQPGWLAGVPDEQ